MNPGSLQQRRVLIRGGYVLSMDPAVGDLSRGDILIEGSNIVDVAPAIDADADEVIDASGMLVMPGMVDAHIHLWHTPLRGAWAGFWGFQEYLDYIVYPIRPRGRPEDVYSGTYVGAVELLANGVTTAFDFCHCVMTPDHADSAIRALTEAGLRAVWAYSASGSQGPDERHQSLLDDAGRVYQQHFNEDRPLLEMGMALTSHIGAQAGEENRREIAFARERGLRMAVHSNSVNHIRSFADAGLLGPDIIFAHGNVASDEELGMLSDSGATLATSMQVELSLGYSCSALSRAIRAGARAVVAIDSAGMVAPDLLSEARATYNATRALDGVAERDQGRLPLYRREQMPLLTARDVLALVTTAPAAALGLENRIGSIAPGKEADLVLLTTRPFGMSAGDAAVHIVTQATIADVDTVLVAGKVRKRHGQLVDVDRDQVVHLYDAAQRHYLKDLPPHGLPSLAADSHVAPT